jgi:protein-tyrosine phosphatase
MTLLTDQDRDISLEVAHNVRHVGGFVARDGRTTSDRLIRSGNLANLTPAGIGKLRALGVRAVVDLRMPEEVRQKPAPDLASWGIETVRAPVIDDNHPLARFEGEWLTIPAQYERLLEAGMTAYRTLFQTIADCDGAVLYHCSAGKDRAGLATALLLDMAGVEWAQITSDYSRSADLLRSEFPRWEVEFRQLGLNTDQIAQLLCSKAEDMAATLDCISARWGSSEGYLAAAGLSETARSAVRRRIVA